MDENKLELRVSEIFKDFLETDERINPELAHCLYCSVITEDRYHSRRDTEYAIKLEEINSNMKQCPACKKVYILSID